jgi:uncharacterized membrane protein HdeD (DUF308 family)
LILAAIAFAYPGQTAAVLTYAFGAYILLNGFAMLAGGLIALSYAVGVYATLAGIASIAFAVRLRGLAGEVEQGTVPGRVGA